MWDASVAFARRPGVLQLGWLSKEGAHTLSRAFPSRRFFILTSQGRLEYYEEKTVQQRRGSDPGHLNDWNLVVFCGALEGNSKHVLAVGDVVMAVNNAALGQQSLHDVLSTRVSGEPYTLTILRPKGEVPVLGAKIELIPNSLRVRITPSLKELLAVRPPYVLIASCEGERDEWYAALEECARRTGPAVMSSTVSDPSNKSTDGT